MKILCKAIVFSYLALAPDIGLAQTFEPGVDRPGSDISSFDVPGHDPHTCQSACSQNGGCVAWTYVSAGIQGPVARCWLKSAVPDARGNPCCVSGTMPRSSQAQDPDLVRRRMLCAMVGGYLSGPWAIAAFQRCLANATAPPPATAPAPVISSTILDHPAPLGPGVNRGNIDNFGGGHAFYFFAGPGHVDVELAFEEMGMFGSPLRQGMNFDFYTDDNKLASHHTIDSQGALARAHSAGDFASRERLRLVVTAQTGALRLGGYYEIEVKGAAAFEGPTVGVGVQPILSESLVKSGSAPLLNAPVQLVK